MYMRNVSLSRTKLVIATALTLLFSVAQSDETRLPPSGLAGFDLPDSGFDLGYSNGLIDIGGPGFTAGSNATVAISNTDGFGELSLVEMNTDDSNRMHFNFRSNLTNELQSATLVTSGNAYSLTFNLPSGQILLENDKVSVITPTAFSQMSLSGSQAFDLGDGHFSATLNNAYRGSDMLGFNMSLAESLAETDLLSLSLPDRAHGKEGYTHTDGAWACAGALTALAAANAGLAAAIAATYATVGLAAAAISAAVSLVGGAIVMVDQYCMQM